MRIVGNVLNEFVLLLYPLVSSLPSVMYAEEMLDGSYKDHYATTSENILVYNDSIKWFNKETEP